MEYTINQVAKRTNLTTSTLRYYDKEGLLPQLQRSESGIRKYTEDDLGWIELICCLKNSGMSIKKIKSFIDLCLKGKSTTEERRQILIEHKAYIQQQMELLQCSLGIVNYKIEHCSEIGFFGTHKEDNEE